MSSLHLKVVLRTAAALAAVVLLGGCEGGRSEVPRVVVPGGSAQRGADIIQSVGCGACHHIPGIDGAEGVVGPPLYFWARRSYIAGEVPNSPDNLVRWVRNAHQIEPGTAMPNLGLSEQQGRDVAQYLYTIN